MKALLAALLIFIPSIAAANSYYNSLANGPNVRERFIMDDYYEEDMSATYKMEVERIPGGDMLDRLSGLYIETMSACRLIEQVNRAVLVKSGQNYQLFFDTGASCGVKKIYTEFQK